MRRPLLPLMSALLAVALATVLATVSAGPAAAHTRLVSSTPTPGAPAQAPREVVLVFSDPVQPSLSAVSVTGTDGEQRTSGTPTPRGDGASLVQALREPLEPGTYRVAYRVLAADGHPVTGSFELTAVASPAVASAPTTAAPAPTSTTTSAVQPASSGADDGGGAPVLALVAGGLAVAGGAGLLARRFGGAPPSA